MPSDIFFAARNLTEKTVVPVRPWEFQITEPISEEVRHDKKARQAWYKDPAIRHSFYSLIEASNPNQRASREDNPPRLLHGIAADYDMALPDESVQAAVVRMPIKPAWVERSLGGNVRLVWLFPRPLPAESYDFCTALLQAAVAWLKMNLLAGLDEPAVSDPARLLCNGGVWRETGHGTVPEAALQAFFVKTGRAFRFVSEDGVEIPLDRIEKALREKYPKFCWPNEFALESSGPSFWIAESQSSNSAILKVEGFVTFSAHATKIFYSWSDILGAEFVAQYTVAAVAKATGDVWYDGRKFWRRKKGCYMALDKEELTNYLKVDCGLSVKGGHIEKALSHIFNEQFVENASPYLFKPSGLIVYQGRRRLNTALNEVMQPATGSQNWGPQGNFPFLSALLDNIFTSQVQRDHFLAWFLYFYNSGLSGTPMPGQAVFLMGGVCTGKTFTSREVVGRAVGGYMDAANYIIRGGEFNSHLFEYALWALDDDTISDSPQAAANVQAMLKKAVANNSFLSNKKFQVAGMVEWSGRIIATTNTDYISSRMLGPLDNSSLDKISVYRCHQTSQIKFPSRAEMESMVSVELPSLLRWLTDHTPPDNITRDSRFGFRSWHEPTLMDQASQTSKSAPFQEILIETLEEFFKDNPAATEWRGTVSRLIMQIHCNPLREHVIRTLRLEQVSRYLESVEKNGALNCRTETGALNTRLWIFPRLGGVADTAPEPLPEQTRGSIFDK